MKDIVPEAYVDNIVILNDVPISVAPVSVHSLHLYAYLGCVLALFNGQPVAEWGYPFAITSEGFPFSAELDQARANLVSRGLVDVDNLGSMIARQPEMESELKVVFQFGSWSQRRVWLRTATECALALPLGAIRHAVNRSPGMAEAFLLGQRRRLLEPMDASLLYEEYDIISKVLGTDARDALSPAVIWLSARILRKDGNHVTH